MSKRLFMAVLAMVMFSLTISAFAGDEAKKAAPAMPAMPDSMMAQMGPPKEITACAEVVGTWDVATQMRMDPNAEFMPSAGVAVMSMVAGGAAIQTAYNSNIMGMPFEGLGLTTYNRSNGQWTTTWVDNMGGKMSTYTGTKKDGKGVYLGKDEMMGQIWDTRITEMDPKDGKFDWMMEHSMDGGKTWNVFMKSVYTKRK